MVGKAGLLRGGVTVHSGNGVPARTVGVGPKATQVAGTAGPEILMAVRLVDAGRDRGLRTASDGAGRPSHLRATG